MNIVDGVVVPGRQLTERSRDLAERVLELARVEEGQFGAGQALRARRAPQVVRRGADEAVADPQAMIEEPERLSAGERGQPERQARQLDGDGIRVGPGQTALGNQPANIGPRFGIETGLVATSLVDEGALVGAGKIAAGGDEEGAAAHGWIDDPQCEYSVGRGA